MPTERSEKFEWHGGNLELFRQYVQEEISSDEFWDRMRPVMRLAKPTLNPDHWPGTKLKGGN